MQLDRYGARSHLYPPRLSGAGKCEWALESRKRRPRPGLSADGCSPAITQELLARGIGDRSMDPTVPCCDHLGQYTPDSLSVLDQRCYAEAGGRGGLPGSVTSTVVANSQTHPSSSLASQVGMKSKSGEHQRGQMA